MPLTRPKMHQIVTSTFEVNDPILYLNADHSGANANDLGIIINRGTSGDNVGIMWDRSAQAFALVTTTADGDSTGDLTFSAYADLQCRQLELQNFAFPLADGDADQVLATNGSGVLSWVTKQSTGAQILASLKTVDVDGTAGVNAGTLASQLPSASAGNSTIVQRHASGYIYANYFNTTPNDITDGAITKVLAESGGDGFMRHASASVMRTFLNVEDGATASGAPTGSIIPAVNNTSTIGNGSFKYLGMYATTFYGQSTSAQYADVAEIYEADKAIEPGTVVCFGGDAEVTTQEEDHSTNIVGIVSTNPAYLMNSGCKGEYVVAIALLGRVPCAVIGSVLKGDLLVSAGNGAARSESNPKLASIIGRAVESFVGDHGVIEVLVGRV